MRLYCGIVFYASCNCPPNSAIGFRYSNSLGFSVIFYGFSVIFTPLRQFSGEYDEYKNIVMIYPLKTNNGIWEKYNDVGSKYAFSYNPHPPSLPN